MLKNLNAMLSRLRLPSVCSVCKQYHNDILAVCKRCCAFLTPNQPACMICALPIATESTFPCGHCITHRYAFDKVYAAYLFEEPLRSLLHQYKYQKAIYLRNTLANLMLKAIENISFDTECLIPVPMHPARLRLRGFNQAAELTKQLAALTQIPYQFNLCKKVVNTAPQAQLDAKQREDNLKGAFRVKPSDYKHITLVDDLLTTGSTTHLLAQLFKLSGVEKVTVWCLARVGK